MDQRHLLLFPYPGQGHINPLLQLSLRLASRFQITFVTTITNHTNIIRSWSEQGLRMPPPQHNLRMASIPDDNLPPRTMQGLNEFIRGLNILSQPLEDLILKLNKEPNSAPVACIISDSLMTWVPDLASKLGICWVPYFPCPVSMFLSIQHAAQGLLPESGSDDEMIKVPGLVPFQYSELPMLAYPQFASSTDVGGGLVRQARNAPWILINTCDSLEHEALQVARQDGFNFVPVAPLLPPSFVEKKQLTSEDDLRTSSLWKQDDSCLEWLHSQEPSSVLYISFGSIAGMTLENLWVLRPDLVSGLTEEKYTEFVEKSRLHDQGLVVRWSPQLQVLLHPAVGVFLTHCGWNSTFESICAELPMICWPFCAEQKLNCKYIVDVWRIGVKLSEKNAPFPSRISAMESSIKITLLLVLVLISACAAERHLLQAARACSTDFSKVDYSSVTRVCKAPYSTSSCCPAFTSMACKFKPQVNDFSSTCPVNFMAYLNFAGAYPNGVFVGRCTSGTTLC